MIGQKGLLMDIDRVIERYPHFSIIVGDKGCGKRTICKEIINKLSVTPLYFDTSIDSIRGMIDLAYTQVKPIAFIIPDADNMSISAKNSMLKITEEPPKNVYIILTLQNLDNTLNTIKSRGTVFHLDNYTKTELIEYRVFRGYNADNDNIIRLACDTTGEVDELFSYNVKDFYNFANQIANYIHVPTSGNTFKITKSMKLKDTDSGFTPILLLKMVSQIFIEKTKETRKKQYLEACMCTQKYIKDLRISTLNKLSIIDMWIIDVRSCLRGI